MDRSSFLILLSGDGSKEESSELDAADSFAELKAMWLNLHFPSVSPESKIMILTG